MDQPTADPNDPDFLADTPMQYCDPDSEIPKPVSRLDLDLLASRWTVGNAYPEEIAGIAADLLEAGSDTPSLRRLAGEWGARAKRDVEDLVAKTFQELSIAYPIPEELAIAILTRQIAREVVWGVRSLRSGASFLEFGLWNWRQEINDLWTLYELNDEFDWDCDDRRPVSEIANDMVETFKRLAAPTD